MYGNVIIIYNMLAIIAKWTPQFGRTADSAIDIDSHWLLLDVIYRDDFFNNIQEVNKTLEFYKKNYRGNKNHVKIALVKDPIQLDTREIVTVEITHNINIIKRLWRKKKNLEIISS